MDIVGEVFGVARDRVCERSPYLAIELAGLRPTASTRVECCGWDGERLLVNEAWVRERFLAGGTAIEEALLHAAAHRLLGHTELKDADATACDLHVALVLAKVQPAFVSAARSGVFIEARRRCGQADGVAELARRLREDTYLAANREALVSVLAVDEHGLWRPEAGRAARASGQGLLFGGQHGNGRRPGGDGSGVLRWRETRVPEAGGEYAGLLKRYTVCGEDLRIDPDLYDPGMYALGLELYGDMPILEPSESTEACRIAELVIGIDTSGSCSRGLTKHFLSETREIMRNDVLFFRRFRLHIVQCDTRVRRADVITDMAAFADYIRTLELNGGGGTDFRPFIGYVDRQRERGELTRLKGMLLFTDGMGIYPEQMPDYELTCVLPDGRYDAIDMPAWVRRLVIPVPQTEVAG